MQEHLPVLSTSPSEAIAASIAIGKTHALPFRMLNRKAHFRRTRAFKNVNGNNNLVDLCTQQPLVVALLKHGMITRTRKDNGL